MRNSKTNGFTLIELLIVIAIIGILAAVLIPNLLNARQRAFDTAAQTCLKEIATNEEIIASVDPWEYSSNSIIHDGDGPLAVTVTMSDGTTTHDVDITSCEGVIVQAEGTPSATVDTAGGATTWYAYNASHVNGGNTYEIEIGSGVALQTAGSILANAATP